MYTTLASTNITVHWGVQTAVVFSNLGTSSIPWLGGRNCATPHFRRTNCDEAKGSIWTPRDPLASSQYSYSHIDSKYVGIHTYISIESLVQSSSFYVVKHLLYLITYYLYFCFRNTKLSTIRRLPPIRSAENPPSTMLGAWWGASTPQT